MYLRQNATEEFIGDLRDISQSTVSRIVTTLVPIIKAVLEEFVPDAKDAITMVQGRVCLPSSRGESRPPATRRVCLVDGTITPCWSYDEHPELWSRKKGTTGFNAQVISLLDGTPVYLSDPLPGKTHDALAFTETPVEEIVQESGGAIADKGYQGHVEATPRKTPPSGQLGERDKECNAEISALRAPIERVVAHVKSWRILHTDYRRPYHTYRDAYDATRGLFFFSINWGFE